MKRKNKDGSVREYVYLVEGERINGKVRQRNIGTLGRLDALLEGRTFQNVLEKLCELRPEFREKLAILNHQDGLDRESARGVGLVSLYRQVWQELGLDKILSRAFEKRKTGFSIEESALALVSHRLIEPSSKREAAEWVKTVYEPKWETLELQHLYRTMDYVVGHKKEFEKELFERIRQVFKVETETVLFDTTSICSYSEGKHSSLLMFNGHSKDHRPDLRQIMVGLLMSKTGIPLGHEVWEGNQSDKKSFRSVIDRVQTHYGLKEVILVGDRGMISTKNIEALEEAEYRYILGVPMRRGLDKEKRQMLLGWEREKLVSEIPEFELVKATKEGRLYAKDVILEDKGGVKRYLVCFDPQEAEYEAKRREYFKEILKKKAEFSSLKEWVVKNGYKKYVSFESAEGGGK